MHIQRRQKSDTRQKDVRHIPLRKKLLDFKTAQNVVIREQTSKLFDLSQNNNYTKYPYVKGLRYKFTYFYVCFKKI